MFRGAGVIPVTKEGRILLQLRSAEETNGANTWGNFGGGASEGETFEQCAVREFCEETGSDPSCLGVDDLMRFAARKDEHVEYVTFLCFVDSVERFPFVDGNESCGYGWFDVKDPSTNNLPYFEPFVAACAAQWGDWLDAIRVYADIYCTPASTVKISNRPSETATPMVKPVPKVKPVKPVQPTKETMPTKEVEPVKEEKTTEGSIEAAFDKYNN
jgi:8-oxo-dGTP pyrophosphatase MutT (NUDIX family)